LSADDVRAAEALTRQYIGNHNRYANVVSCDPEELNWYLRRRNDAFEVSPTRGPFPLESVTHVKIFPTYLTFVFCILHRKGIMLSGLLIDFCL
jgi:hypothetical protein